jgi:hypothetical protein
VCYAGVNVIDSGGCSFSILYQHGVNRGLGWGNIMLRNTLYYLYSTTSIQLIVFSYRSPTIDGEIYIIIGVQNQCECPIPAALLLQSFQYNHFHTGRGRRERTGIDVAYWKQKHKAYF